MTCANKRRAPTNKAIAEETMKLARGEIRSAIVSTSLVALFAAAGSVFSTSDASAAIPGCDVSSLNALGVATLTVSSATDQPAAGLNPEFCDVSGSVTTSGFGAPNGTAQFEMQLPANWNHKFYFKGIGGFAGIANIAFGSDNPFDASEVLAKGYATVITDTGHTWHGFTPTDFTGIVTDARWALKPDGTPDEAKLTDYYFRATHEVTLATKQLAEAFFNGDIQRAYFDGCSNGGRMAMVEASRFPDDFDGIIAGDPFMSIRAIAAGPHFRKQQLQSGNFIPFTLLAMIDQATRKACDAADGVTDGLIQNPAACSFKVESLQCKAGQTSNCLSAGQVETLRSYFSAYTDDDGNVVYPGHAISDLDGPDGAPLWITGAFLPDQTLPPPNTQATFDLNAPEPWGNDGFSPSPLGWQFEDHGIKFIVERDPNFNVRTFDGTAITPMSDAALALFDRRTEAGDADDPAAFSRFIAKDRKLLIYHGLSDPALTPIRTIQFYESLAERGETGSINELQEDVRLFLVPGMHHCSGGPGPNFFDTLTALENWVEKGKAPDAIVATKFVNDAPSQGVSRTMPLC